jgi:SAM-dependent methyltransferase
MFRSADGPVCNICGHDKFEPGPNGRLSSTKKPPCCSKCRSLERHRSMRFCYDSLPIGFLRWRRGLQFSRDMSVQESWFKTFEISQYGKENSIDAQNIERPDASYDYIVMNHVLEVVPDAKRAMKELMRVLSPEGVLQICFARPHLHERTIDYSTPYSSDLFLHQFGMDLEQYFQIAAMGVECFHDRLSDPVTGATQDVHFFARDWWQLSMLRSYSALRGKLASRSVVSSEGRA